MIDDEDDSDPPYRVVSPTRVWLSKTARQLAAMAPMTEIAMARHLLRQHELKRTGLVQKDGED